MSTNKPSTLMTHVAWETKLYSVARSSMHSCLGNCVAIGRAVVYYARAAHAFSAGIKCRHCKCSHTWQHYQWSVRIECTELYHVCITYNVVFHHSALISVVIWQIHVCLENWWELSNLLECLMKVQVPYRMSSTRLWNALTGQQAYGAGLCKYFCTNIRKKCNIS